MSSDDPDALVDDSSFEDSIIIPFYIENRVTRIHVGGPRGVLRQFIADVASHQRGMESEEAALSKVAELARIYHVTIGDIFTANPSSMQRRFDIVDLLLKAAESSTAERAWSRVDAVLSSATDDELEVLADPQQIARVRPIIRSLLDDLDENRPDAEAQIRTYLSPHVSYLLLA